MRAQLLPAEPAEQTAASSANNTTRADGRRYLPASETAAAAPTAITSFGHDRSFPPTHVEPSRRPPPQNPSSSPLPPPPPPPSPPPPSSSSYTFSPPGTNGREIHRAGDTHRHRRRPASEKEGGNKEAAEDEEEEEEEEADDSSSSSGESDVDDPMSRPALLRQNEGRSHLPLLQDNRGRPSYDSPDDPNRRSLNRRSQMRSRSPDATAQMMNRKKYTYAAFFLALSL
ncbi:hypothetical protein GP486_008737, partial [Trichoglossum hirsutum]